MNKIVASMVARLEDESGATASEYAVLVALMVFLIGGGAAVFGGELATIFGNLTDTLGL